MKKLLVLALMAVLASTMVLAGDMSVVLTRTNPGVVGKQTAELIFSVANMDTEHRMEGFMLCRTPDDARVTAAFGAGVGDAAQYMSPTIVADTAPYLKSMSVTLEASNPGDKRADCTFKYIPFKLQAAEATTTTEEFTETATITKMGTDVQGHNLVLKSFTEAVEAAEATDTAEAVEAAAAKAELEIEGTATTLNVAEPVTAGGLTVTLNSGNAETVEVTVKGTKTVTVEAGAEVKSYLLMNGKYKTAKADMDYRQIRLDKTVPFVEDMSEPECPEGKTECKAAEVVEVGGMKIPVWGIIVGVLLVVLIVAYLLGKTSRKHD